MKDSKENACKLCQTTVKEKAVVQQFYLDAYKAATLRNQGRRYFSEIKTRRTRKRMPPGSPICQIIQPESYNLYSARCILQVEEL